MFCQYFSSVPARLFKSQTTAQGQAVVLFANEHRRVIHRGQRRAFHPQLRADREGVAVEADNAGCLGISTC